MGPRSCCWWRCRRWFHRFLQIKHIYEWDERFFFSKPYKSEPLCVCVGTMGNFFNFARTSWNLYLDFRWNGNIFISLIRAPASRQPKLLKSSSHSHQKKKWWERKEEALNCIYIAIRKIPWPQQFAILPHGSCRMKQLIKNNALSIFRFALNAFLMMHWKINEICKLYVVRGQDSSHRPMSWKGQVAEFLRLFRFQSDIA